MKSNYDKYPSIKVPNGDGRCVQGWDAANTRLHDAIVPRGTARTIVTIGCYTGVFVDEIITALQAHLGPPRTRRWREERTGLHALEFIETGRHWFTGAFHHHTGGTLNVLNLVEGREAIIESPNGAFDPFVVHYAETFIVPAAMGAYTIRPHGEGIGTECATLKAFVR
jgi:hypothetical protein